MLQLSEVHKLEEVSVWSASEERRLEKGGSKKEAARGEKFFMENKIDITVRNSYLRMHSLPLDDARVFVYE